MGNRKRLLSKGRLTWNGEIEHSVPSIPPGATENFYRRPVVREEAEKLFNMGQAIYVNGLRTVKA
jgi:hypothetical protein